MNHRFITISTYAKLCNINRESVYKRIKCGKLATSIFCEHPMIDLEEYPPHNPRIKPQPPAIKKKLPNWCYD